MLFVISNTQKNSAIQAILLFQDWHIFVLAKEVLLFIHNIYLCIRKQA
jgi:hypothetical protein